MLERECAAYGASGRNAGILGDSIDHSHGLAISHFGRDEAARLALLGRANVAEMTGFLAVRGNRLRPRAHAAHCTSPCAKRISRSYGRTWPAPRSLGIDDFRLIDAEETRARLRSPLYLGALFDPSGAILDPVRLVEGLTAEAERLGVRIFEARPGFGHRGGG